jgi:predicted permease
MLDELRLDLRYALRSLVKRPGFAAVILLTLALGIGATTSIYSVVDAVLLRPLPFHAPDRLVTVWGTETGMRTGSGWMSYDDWVDFKAESKTLETIAVFSATNPGQIRVHPDGGPPVHVPVARASADFFRTLGVPLLLGRTFTPEEDAPGGPRAVIVSEGYWRDALGGDPTFVGRDVRLNETPYRVVGIAPARLDFLGPRIWLPLEPGHAEDGRGMHRLIPVARLAPGATSEEADAEVATIAARLEQEYPETNTRRGARVEAVADRLVGPVRTPMLVLLAAVGVVLLIATVNVANLLLARVAPREREVAVRASIGAGRGRLIRQLLTESLVLALLGGLLGVGLALLGVKLLVAGAPEDIPRLAEVGINGRVLLFSLGLTVFAGLVCGALPAFSASRPDLAAALKQGGDRSATGQRHGRWADGLVVAEVSVAVLLVAAAGLLLHSFVKLQRVDPGFSGDRVVSVPLTYTGEDPFDAASVTRFYDDVLERVRAQPGVEQASLAYMRPLDGGWESSFVIPGVLEPPEGDRPEARIRPVTPGYFATAGIPLLRGREFTAADEGGPGVVLVNETFVRTFLEGRDPLGYSVGKYNWWGEDRPTEYRIIGVVADVKMDGLAEQTPWAMYPLHDQWPMSDMYLFVRAEGSPLAIVPALREAIHAVDPDVPFEDVRTLPQLRSEDLSRERFETFLIGAFALLAVLLACVGVFGVLSHAVSRRTAELGVRMALGARAGDVVRLVAGRGAVLVGIGVLLGLGAALGLTRLLEGLLFGVSPTEPATLAASTGILVVVALVASVLPALRASRLDPVKALRSE